MLESLVIRDIKQKDCAMISAAFQAQGWHKPIQQYETYVSLQAQGIRDVLLAEINHEFVGYLTIVWESGYSYFRQRGIPEIVDFNVLKKFQRRGIGQALMDEAENRISKVSNLSGIGFGMMEDYGAAQILYVKRGYIPNGQGLYDGDKKLQYGDTITMDDSIILYLVKTLSAG